MTPRISIITSSYNQGQFIERTIQSVLAQDYANFEHIIVDGMSSDETLDILMKYPHLKIIRERDQGQADAINKGFKLATGDIITFLNSDDTLHKDTLKSVVKEINPDLKRHIVMGRCQFIDEKDHFLGIEHPSHFIDHKTVLKIWKGYFIPQPAVFWSREVLNQCGHLDINDHKVLDYDLFCRFSQKYVFHCVDQVYASYRLHSQSKTESMNFDERLHYSIKVSKQYWGSVFNLFYWELYFSLLHYRRRKHAKKMLHDAKRKWRQTPLNSIVKSLYGILMGPDILWNYVFNARLAKKVTPHHWLQQYPQIKAYRHYEKVWSDQWVGPNLVLPIEKGLQRHLKIQGQTFKKMTSLLLNIIINGEMQTPIRITNQSTFELNLPLQPTTDEVRIQTNDWFIMHHYTRNEDYRPLAWKLLNMTLD